MNKELTQQTSFIREVKGRNPRSGTFKSCSLTYILFRCYQSLTALCAKSDQRQGQNGVLIQFR